MSSSCFQITEKVKMMTSLNNNQTQLIVALQLTTFQIGICEQLDRYCILSVFTVNIR